MLSSLDVENFRCIERAHLEFDQRATGIVGRNAAGKTSLLEAIYFLGHGRSFRSQQREQLIRNDTEWLRVVAKIESERGRVPVGIEYGKSGRRIHIGGSPAAGFSEIASLLPIQVIDPGVHRIIEEGSARRRRLLDWGVFHVKHDFLFAWRRYQRALLQRNAALRAGQPSSLARSWDRELVAAAAIVDAARNAYYEQLSLEFTRWAAELVELPIELDYRRGWRRDTELIEALNEAFPRDQRLKTTSIGPHRADLVFRSGGAPARERISRGQQKMLASAFVLTLVALKVASGDQRICLLLDDPAAELDVDNLGKLLGAVTRLPAQLVVTAVSEQGLRGLPVGRTFHVEQGRVGL